MKIATVAMEDKRKSTYLDKNLEMCSIRQIKNQICNSAMNLHVIALIWIECSNKQHDITEFKLSISMCYFGILVAACAGQLTDQSDPCLCQVSGEDIDKILRECPSKP